MFDGDLLRDIARDDWLQRLRKNSTASEAEVEKLLQLISEVFQQIPPEVIQGNITVLVSDQSPPCLGVAAHRAGSISDLSDLLYLTQVHLTLMRDEMGGLLLWTEVPNDEELVEQGLVYRYDGDDHFLLPGLVIDLPSSTSIGSVFAMPSFLDLEDALDAYERDMARHCSCRVLGGCWDDERRMVLANKPEKVMRQSLEQYLRSRLRGYDEVRPEQNVDESHPIDIKVSWSGNKIALIEIKWIGSSVNMGGTGTTDWDNKRANDGAKQLAGYLDMNKPATPAHTVIGYLVVFDARREGVSLTERNPTDEDALHFLSSELEYEPAYHEIRADFAEPVRLFMRPKTQVA